MNAGQSGQFADTPATREVLIAQARRRGLHYAIKYIGRGMPVVARDHMIVSVMQQAQLAGCLIPNVPDPYPTPTSGRTNVVFTVNGTVTTTRTWATRKGATS